MLQSCLLQVLKETHPITLFCKAAMAAGTAGDKLRPNLEALVETVNGYKTAAVSVKSLLPKAKGKAKAQARSHKESE